MNNFKKIGLTALAGSLALISVAQAEVVLSGSSEATYTTSDESSTGNPIGYSNDLNIDASGEFNNGWTYTTHLNFAGQDMTADSNSLVVGMGDLGSIGIDQGVELFGISGMTNFGNPSAYEEADHSVSSLDDTLDANASGVIGYNGSFAGVSLSLEYQPTTTAFVGEAGAFQGAGETGSNINYMVSAAVPFVDGLTIAAGHSKDSNDVAGTVEDEELTYGARYTFSNVTLGYQVIQTQSGTTGTAGNNGEMYGVAVNVNENFSVSYNIADMEVDRTAGGVNTTEESTGISAAYSMGSASVRFSYNEADNVGGVAGQKDDNTEISLALAF
ncbi:porin [Candidatus Pelagibacter ubique]|nr:porin [Candidatus Pelagibacter ubique]